MLPQWQGFRFVGINAIVVNPIILAIIFVMIDRMIRYNISWHWHQFISDLINKKWLLNTNIKEATLAWVYIWCNKCNK